MGSKPDLEIFALLAKELREDLGVTKPDAVFEEIRRSVRGYDLPFGVVETGGAAATVPLNGRVEFQANPDLIRSAGNTLFTSGTLGRFSKMLNSVIESPGALYHDPGFEPLIEDASGQLEVVAQREAKQETAARDK
jgi:NADH-quinone oxidoreductase subunit G